MIFFYFAYVSIGRTNFQNLKTIIIKFKNSSLKAIRGLINLIQSIIIQDIQIVERIEVMSLLA